MSPTNAYVRKPLPRLREPGSAYFVTWRLALGQPALSDQERSIIAASLQNFDSERYDLYGWVVMDDHVHVVASPLEPASIDQAIHGWRSFTAAKLCREGGRRPPVWQRGGYDRVVRAGGELEQKIAYVVANPWRRWPDCGDYPWVWPLKET